MSSIPGVRVVSLSEHADSRGHFVETYRKEWFPDVPPMVQANHSVSLKGVLRGLHSHRRQADYWVCPRGRLFVVLMDLRVGSPSEGRVETLEIGERRSVGLYIPPGVAHGYCALTEAALSYQVDQYYDPADEHGVAWDDPEFDVPWPCEGPPILSARDRANPRRAALEGAALVPFSPHSRRFCNA